jgi:hypothetical protein
MASAVPAIHGRHVTLTFKRISDADWLINKYTNLEREIYFID